MMVHRRAVCVSGRRGDLTQRNPLQAMQTKQSFGCYQQPLSAFTIGFNVFEHMTLMPRWSAPAK